MNRKKLLLTVLLSLPLVLCAVAANNPDSIAVITGFPTILPDPGVAVDWYDSHACYNLYDPLVYPSSDGGIRSHIATAWWPVDDNPKIWRFRIREGIRFHDGTELGPEDVAFSMERFMALGSGYSGTIGKVIRTEVVGVDEVEFELEIASVVFPETLPNFWIVNKDLVLANIADGNYGDLGDYGQDWLLTNDAGSGPYIMTEHEVNDRLKAVRFEDYFLGWGDPDGVYGSNAVPVDNVVFLFVTEPGTATAMMRARQIDVSTVWWANETMTELDRIEGIDIQYFPSAVISIHLNTTEAPTDDIHFRRAMAYALDYEAIESIFPYSESGAPTLLSLPGYNQDMQLIRRDLDKARAELALSKYDPADAQVVIHWCAGVDAEALIIMQMQANLAEIGITAEVSPVPWMALSSESGNPETTPTGAIQMVTPTYPSADTYLYYMYHPDVLGGVFAGHWLLDEEIGRLLDESRLTVDQETRMGLYEEIQERIVSLVPIIYPVNAKQPHPIQDYLIGPSETFEMVGPNVSMWYYRIDLDRKAELLGN